MELVQTQTFNRLPGVRDVTGVPYILLSDRYALPPAVLLTVSRGHARGGGALTIPGHELGDQDQHEGSHSLKDA